MSTIRIGHYFRLTAANGTVYRFQNYFVSQSSTYLGESYGFAPFQAEGSTATLNGDNQQLNVLFPNVDYGLQLLNAADGNHLSELRLTTAWLTDSGQVATQLTDFYVGLGAGFSETTIELRFRSAIDSVGSEFPGRTLTRALVGPLPLNAELYLR